MTMAKRLAAEEGLLCGPSTGANITVALELARRLGPGSRVATTNVDSGLKYLAGHLHDA
jgi:cysteine synthase A